MMIRTLPPVHQTMGEMWADVVRINGILLNLSRRAILAARSCSFCGAGRVWAVNSRAKRTTRRRDQTRTIKLPANQKGPAHCSACFNATEAKPDFGSAGDCPAATALSAAPADACDASNALPPGDAPGRSTLGETLLTAGVSGWSETARPGTVTRGGVTSLTRTSSHSRFARCGRFVILAAAIATIASASEKHALLSPIFSNS